MIAGSESNHGPLREIQTFPVFLRLGVRFSFVRVLRMRMSVLCAWLISAASLIAAERRFDFADTHEDQPPSGFRNAVTGLGRPGDWKVLLDAVPPILEPLTPNAPSVAKRPVLAQLSQDPTDEHFPLLIFE